ncbi:MAG TPA: U32 family peptidase [Candidatus Avirikenella pullistercoris]|nr:U32 family peptidase [Candidatus Avirikenella pullistercoris]
MAELTRKDIELMAPVGSYESLMAAIQGGADSVYFGVEKLNMRSQSSFNFTLEDLEKIVTICKEHGIKSYLTVNCILYDEDIATMHEIIDHAKKAGITAIIASDQAAITYARSVGTEVHISTQLNVSNTETLRFYAAFADVVVLARELNLKQVRHIYDEIRKQNIRGPHGELIKIEMFAHGALCMAVSGKCYLSLHDADKSANRGSCRQICRRAYEVRDKDTGAELLIENQYIMSPKDLCTIDFLDELLEAGVRVLKIEGRARSAEYVKRVCECYDEAINAVIDGSFSNESVAKWKEKLSTVFNRGFWGGYYLGQKLGEWSRHYGSSATKKKVYVGKVTNFFKKLSVAEILIEAAPLQTGEELIILGETTGVVELKAEEIRVDLMPVQTAVQGEKCSLVTPQLVRRGDKLYKLTDKN